MKYLIDTDTVSYFLRGTPEVVERLTAIRPSDWAISAVTAFELQRGSALRPQNQRLADRITRFLRVAEVCELNLDQAILSAELSASLQIQGTPISHLDAMIAGHAMALNATLVTNNIKHFERVDGLRVESWVA